MKKWVQISLAAVAVAAAAAIGIGAYQHHQATLLAQSLSQAEQLQETRHNRYQAAMNALNESRLTVTEDDQVIGVYTLDQLGLAEDARASIESAFGASDLLSPEEFSALPQDAQLEILTNDELHTEPVSLDLDDLDVTPVLNDLDAVTRRPSVDCKPLFTGAGFKIQAEIPGTELDEARVAEALNSSMEGQSLAEEPLTLRFEVTDCDPYLAPEVTMENQQFNLNEILRDILVEQDYSLHVNFRGTDVALDANTCANMLQVSDDGRLYMIRELAAPQVEFWAELYSADKVPYYFHSYSAGNVELPFLTASCRLDQEALLDRMEEAMNVLSQEPIDAPFDWTDRYGRDIDLSGTYVEVDIARQTMTCFQDGELLVTTPVVSGRPWDGHTTPSGYYKVQSKSPNRWLTGPDYSVFVQYWLGFHGAYGIHDAKWRSAFGDEIYKRNGSHGCVNTPTEAMEQIYNCAEIGMPVVVFDIPKD